LEAIRTNNQYCAKRKTSSNTSRIQLLLSNMQKLEETSFKLIIKQTISEF